MWRENIFTPDPPGPGAAPGQDAAAAVAPGPAGPGGGRGRRVYPRLRHRAVPLVTGALHRHPGALLCPGVEALQAHRGGRPGAGVRLEVQCRLAAPVGAVDSGICPRHGRGRAGQPVLTWIFWKHFYGNCIPFVEVDGRCCISVDASDGSSTGMGMIRR